MENLPFGTAAYALMDGIDTSSRLADKKKELNDTFLKIQMMNLVSACQKDAITTLMRLQFYGVKEDQILKTCRSIEANGLYNMNGAPQMNSRQFSVF